MFIFHVEADTPSELLDKIASKLLAIGLIAPVKDSDAVDPLPTIEGPADEPPAPPPAPSDPPPIDAGALRGKIRALAAPLMTGDKAAAVKALIKRYGASITAVPDDKLADLKTELEAL